MSSSSEPDITPKILLEHIQQMGQTLQQLDLRGVETRLSGRMDELERRIDRVERNLSTQIDGIDRRLDEIEIEGLPSRVATLEQKIGR